MAAGRSRDVQKINLDIVAITDNIEVLIVPRVMHYDQKWRKYLKTDLVRRIRNIYYTAVMVFGWLNYIESIYESK